MLQNKKHLMMVMLCLFVAGLVFAQTSSLVTRYLQRADDQYTNMQYEEAFKTINAALKLSENKDEIPGNVYLLATQIYTKLLEKMTKTKDFTLFSDVTMNLQTYPKIAEEPQVQKFVKQILQIQADMKDAERDAATRKTMESIADKQQAQNKEIMESIAATQQAGNEEMKEAIRQGLESAGEKTADAVREVSETTNNTIKELSENSHKTIWIIVILGSVGFIVFLILVMVGIRASSRATRMQAEQLDSTLKLIAGMQQTNNQLLLGGVTDFGGMGLKSAGSSRWGMDALPAPEINDDEKAELKQLVIDCEKLGSEIDAVTRRKNNSKNVSELVYKLAMRLGLDQNSSMIYFAAAMVYDAGFLAVPEELLEAENLTDEQRKQLKEHVKLYEQYLGFVPRKYWQIFKDAAMYHHENNDGSGYYALMGPDIPHIARLIHVAESYNSLISRRNYKQIMDKETAIEELLSKPNLYDADVVKTLDSIL